MEDGRRERGRVGYIKNEGNERFGIHNTSDLLSVAAYPRDLCRRLKKKIVPFTADSPR